MPRTTNFQITSPLDQIRKLAGQVLVKLRGEIHSKEGDLRRLKAEESKLVALADQRRVSNSTGARRPPAPRGHESIGAACSKSCPGNSRLQTSEPFARSKISVPRNSSQRLPAG